MTNRHVSYFRIVVRISAATMAIVTGSALGWTQGLVTRKELSTGAALSVAQGAQAKCNADGYRVSLTVLDSSGLVKIQVRGDGTGPHTLEHSRRKSYTALTFKRTYAETAKAWASSPTPAPAIDGTVGAGGGVPIKAGNEVIGAIGVSEAPGGEKDEACALAGIARVADSLK
jgi:uncharacterized protein GlcG (DUF336 family)